MRHPFLQKYFKISLRLNKSSFKFQNICVCTFSIWKMFKDHQVPTAPFSKHFKIFESVQFLFQNTSKSLSRYDSFIKVFRKSSSPDNFSFEIFLKCLSLYGSFFYHTNILKFLCISTTSPCSSSFKLFWRSLIPYDSHFKIKNLQVCKLPFFKTFQNLWFWTTTISKF